MKRINPIKTSVLATALAVIGSLASAQAGSFFADFNDGAVPANSAVFGSAAVTTIGGVGDSGCLQLTVNTTNTIGVFILTNDPPEASVVGFTATFKMTVGSKGGDGFSFNFAKDLDFTGNWGNAEDGSGSGLTIEFDTVANGSPDTAPSIDVKVGGTEVATSYSPQLVTVTGNYVDVFIQLNPDLTLTVVYDGIYAYKNLDLSSYLTPSIYPFTGGACFGIGARNGTVAANKWLDNLSIVTRTNAAAFVRSFAPTGRWVQSPSAIDIAITNDNTTVSSSSVALQLDGAAVTPTVTTASGITSIHFAPAAAFGPYTSHTVSLVFADNASPTPNTNTLQYSFSIPATSWVTVFSDGFESYTAGGAALDKDVAGPNSAPNGSGNPWFGPLPPNLHVVGTTGGVNPHSGNNMVQGNNPADFDQVWYNLAYRLHGGARFSANLMLDWWFYDPLGPGGSTYKDFAAIGYYNTCPGDTDYPGTGSLNTGVTVIQRLSLGTYGGDANKYQVRSVGAAGGDGGGADWFNTPTTRSIGWHHGRIIVGPSVGPDLLHGYTYVNYYIDDMINPIFWHIDLYSVGYNVIELNMDYGSTTTGFMDDVSFSVGRPPNLTVTVSGTTVTLTWPGIDWVLQSASVVNGPPGTFTDITSATSPYSYDTATGPQQFFRLRSQY